MKHLFIEEVKAQFFDHQKSASIITNEEVSSIISDWKEQLLVNNKSLFEKKLLKEHITIEHLSEILEAIVTSKSNSFSNDSILNQEISNDQDLGFLLVFDTLININLAKVIKEMNYYNDFFSINKDTILLSYKDYVMSLLVKISEKVIFHEYKLWEERFQGDLITFISRLTNDHYKYYFYNKYPLLIRLVNDELNRAFLFITDIFLALKKDWKSIQQILHNSDSVQDLGFGLGDKHNFGKTVTIVTFNDNLKLLYKPHLLEIDYAYSQFIDFVFNKGKRLKYPIQTPKVILGDTYGWQEFILHKKTDDHLLLKEFYYKAGVHLCLFYVLNGNDLHFQNIISDSRSPMIIDMETLLSPKVYKPNHVPLKNITQVGLLPFSIFANDKHFELGGLTDAKNQKSPFKKKTVNLKEGKMIGEDVYMDENNNIPYNGAIKLIDFMNDIIDGFTNTYDIMIEKKGILLDLINRFFCNSKIRFITRDTMQFSHLLREASHPYLMTNGYLLEKHFDWLWGQVGDTPHLEKVVNSEKKSLLNLDIPYFYALYNSNNLFDFEHKKIDNFFEISPIQNIQESINNISLQDRNRQIWVIKATIVSHMMNQN